MDPKTINGHPAIEAYRPSMDPLMLTVCANCERMRTILFLSGDRWYCTSCRNEGDARPTQIPVRNPVRKR